MDIVVAVVAGVVTTTDGLSDNFYGTPRHVLQHRDPMVAVLPICVGSIKWRRRMSNAHALKIAVAACALLAAAAPATASPGDCYTTSNATWLPIADVVTAAEAQGYSILKVEREDGCYEVYAKNKDGARVKLHLDPTSLKILQTRNKS